MRIQKLETRVLLANFASVNAGGTLSVVGTSKDNSIDVSIIGSNVIAKLDGDTMSFAKSKVKRLWMNGFAGKDSVSNLTHLPSTLVGGAGSDTLTGGSNSDVYSFNSEDGDEEIFGGGGNDVLDFSACSTGGMFSSTSSSIEFDGKRFSTAETDDDTHYTLRAMPFNDEFSTFDFFSNLYAIEAGAGNDHVLRHRSRSPEYRMGPGNDFVELDVDNWTGKVDLGPGNDVLRDYWGGDNGLDKFKVGGSGYDRVIITPDSGEFNQDHNYEVGDGVEDFSAFSAQKLLITGTNANETIVGAGPAVTINGLGGNDKLAVQPVLSDYLLIDPVAVLNGGAGNDTLQPGLAYFDGDVPENAATLIGGSGNDTADYSYYTEDLRISLDNKSNDGPSGGTDNVNADVETVIGGSGNDLIVGNPFKNKLIGNAGNDTLWGGDGNDTLIGGPGKDSLFGQDGSDTIA